MAGKKHRRRARKAPTTQQLHDIAEVAAQKAVASAFKLIGVDVTKEDQVEGLRQTIAYATRVRFAADRSIAWFVRLVGLAILITMANWAANHISGLGFLKAGVVAMQNEALH